MEDPMPEVVKTYDPRVPKSGPWTRFARFAAALAVIAGVFAGANSIINVISGWKPAPIEPQLRIGWLTVDDPKSLECVIKPGDTFRLQKDGAIAGHVRSECYTKLKAIVERPPQGLQPLGKSYFLYVENRGDPIETLTLYERAALTGPKTSHRSVDKGAAIAICMGYEGRSGLMESRMESFDEIEVVRSKGQRSVMAVPSKDLGVRRGASDCGGVTWNYPE
jgi:hypothetical protein